MSETVISATISSLGFLDKDIYQPEPDFIAGIHDLIRFLHNDGNDHLARRMCLSKNILKNDLLPFMANDDCSDDDFGLVLRLSLNLCQPALSVFRFQIPETEEEVQVYYDIDANLINNLGAFCSEKLFRKLNIKIKTFYDAELVDRREVDKILIDRTVMLIRYAFSIGMEGPKCAEISSVNVNSKRQMIDAFLKSGVGDTLFSIARNKMERELAVHILAIISLLFRSFPCESIACIGSEEGTRKTEADNVLKARLDHEVNKIALKRRSLQTRQLGSNYVIKNAALNSENDLLVQKPISDDPLEIIKRRKHAKGPGKRYLVKNFMESVFKENSTISKELALRVRGYCISLISNGFDKLMDSTRDSAFSENRQGLYVYNDVNYFSLATFVLEFMRLARLPLENVSFVLSINFFNHIVSQTMTYFDFFKTDKSNIKLYVLRAQYSLSTFKEVCHLLYAISTDEKENDSFDEICTQIYDQDDYRLFCFHILGELKPQNMTKKLLEDVIMGTHYFLAVMEKRYKKGQLVTIEKKKKKKPAKKARKNKNNQDVHTSEQFEYVQPEQEELKGTWDALKEELYECLRGDIQPTEGLIPIDIALNVDDETHQTFALCQVQSALRERRILDAVALFNASRDLWPDSAFGSKCASTEELMENILEIFNVDLSEEAKKYFEERQKVYKTVSEEDGVGPSASDHEDQKVDDSEYETVQIPFELSDFVISFAKPDVLYWYIYLLRHFEINTDSINKACLKMLHRIAFDQGCHPRLYLASLFNVLLDVNKNFEGLPRDQWKVHRHYELFQFGFFLIKHFLKHLEQRGERLVAELLFFKNAKEAFEIQEGYGEYDAKNKKNPHGGTWPEALEEELKQLYKDYEELEEKPEGISVVDFIVSNLSKERYPKQVKRHLKELGLVIPKNKTKKPAKKRRVKDKYEDEETDAENKQLDEHPSDGEDSPSTASESGGENYLDDDDLLGPSFIKDNEQKVDEGNPKFASENTEKRIELSEDNEQEGNGTRRLGRELEPFKPFELDDTGNDSEQEGDVETEQTSGQIQILSDSDDNFDEEKHQKHYRGRKRVIDSDDEEEEVPIKVKKRILDDDE
ncbi:unnamed protein product [Bursaphelenchus xylophilus]|uniref:(pine wood nematode) hypothetical protein n=1 Tax=Bursaphelenchus xylophilus TaxID=6326 RepID=A0A1I7S360_BURXY|nr:unnamed protein product [Bursaphelenchus xylophilus]CAG9116106.1 unnamed protein product [Bursaphelenchus xylophilus]